MVLQMALALVSGGRQSGQQELLGIAEGGAIGHPRGNQVTGVKMAIFTPIMMAVIEKERESVGERWRAKKCW